MSSSLSIMKLNLSSNPLIMDEVDVSQIVDNKKQGIVSILGSSSVPAAKSIKAAALRRTLSADMSSKSWLSQNGFSSMKKIDSSDELPISEEEDEADEIWASIQKDKNNAVQDQVGKQAGVWNSILLSNDKPAKDGKDYQSSASYVHPLVKRSKSSLSPRSLQICTESLGSETGSEGFSSDSPSSDEDDISSEGQQKSSPLSFEQEVPIIANKYSVSSYYCDKKSSPTRSFPPPIPSLSPSLRMQSHRENGRLVLEAVSVPTKINFLAQRQDGRLVLTFANKDEQVRIQEEKKDDVFEFDDVDLDQEQEAVVKLEEKVEQGPKFVASSVMDIPNRGAILANKFMRLSNRNSSWAKKFNEKVKLDDDEEAELSESKTPLPQSLPRVPRRIPPIPAPLSAASSASFNAYEYCWRRKASAASFMPPLTGKNQTPPPSPKNNVENNIFALSSNSSKSSAFANCKTPPEKTRSGEDRKLKNKADYMVPVTRNCMEPRRPLSFWETYCIATST